MLYTVVMKYRLYSFMHSFTHIQTLHLLYFYIFSGAVHCAGNQEVTRKQWEKEKYLVSYAISVGEKEFIFNECIYFVHTVCTIRVGSIEFVHYAISVGGFIC